MSEEIKKTELSIVLPEQMTAIQPKVQQFISKLTGDLKSQSLAKFNPLVLRMDAIEKYRTLKYDTSTDELKAKSILDLKAARKDIKNFKATIRADKKELKAPHVKVNQDIDTIANTFTEDAVAVFNLLSETFKQYFEDETAKAKAAVEKRDKALIDAKKDLTDQNTEQMKIINRMNRNSELTLAISTITTETMKVLPDYSKEALTKLSNELGQRSLDITPADEELLLADQIIMLKTNFATSINSAKKMIEMQITNMQAPVVQAAPTPIPVQQVAPTPIPVGHEESQKDFVEKVTHATQPVAQKVEMIAKSVTQENPDFFKNALEEIMTEALTKISNISPANDKEKKIQALTKNGLMKFNSQVLNLFN